MRVARLFPVAVIGATAATVIGAAGIAARTAPAAPPDITMYKNEGCLCCDRWADYLRQLGYRVTIEPVTDLPQRFAEHGITPQRQSCHLAEAGAYVFVGHVPPTEVVRVLRDKPKGVSGLSVPMMPVGSYGMEVAGREGDVYDVLELRTDGTAPAVARYRGPTKLE